MVVDQKARVIYQIEVDATRAVAALGRIDKNTERVANNLERFQQQASRAGRFLRNALVGGGIIAAVGRLASGFTRASDAAADLAARLASISGGPTGAAATFSELFDIAQRLGVPLEALGSSLQRFAIAVPNASLRELVDLLETTSQVLVTTGAGVQATNAVLLQLSQGLSSGALRGDEFRSVLENAPVLLQAWAEAGGRAGESLKVLRDESFFTTESAIRLGDQIRENAERLIGFTDPANTVSRAFQRIRNSFEAAFFQSAGSDNPLTLLADQLNDLAEVVVPFTRGSLANLTASFDLLKVAIDGVNVVLSTLLDRFSDQREELDKVEGELGPVAFFFSVKLPAGIGQTAVALRGLGEILRVLGGRALDLFIAAFESGVDKLQEYWSRFLLRITELWNLSPFGIRSPIDTAGLAGDVATRTQEAAASFARYQTLLNQGAETWEQIDEILLNVAKGQQEVADQFEQSALGGIRAGLGVTDRPRGEGPLGPTTPENTAAAASKAAREAARLQKILEDSARKSGEAFKDLTKELEDSLDAAKEFTQDFEADINERIILQENEIRLIQAAEGDRERLRQQLDLETEARRLRAEAIKEENLVLRGQKELAASQLEGGVGAQLIALGDRRRAIEASQEAAEQLESDIEDALDPFKDFFKDLFTDGIGEAEDFTRKLSDLLNNVLSNFLDELLDQSFRTLAQSLAGTGGGGTGGGGGFLSSLLGFGGGGGGVTSAATDPIYGGGFPTGGGGGGAGFLDAVAPLAGLGIGSFIGSKLFDSDSGTSLDSPLDPLTDVPSGANVNIINNGQPLKVDSTSRRSNGDLQLVVSAAVAETQSVYDRNMRRGYGGFAEPLTSNTSAERSV